MLWSSTSIPHGALTWTGPLPSAWFVVRGQAVVHDPGTESVDDEPGGGVEIGRGDADVLDTARKQR